MKEKSRFPWQSLRIYGETALIASLFYYLIALTRPEIPDQLVMQEFAMVSIIAGSYLAFRLKGSTRKPPFNLLEEAFRGLILTTLLGLLIYIFQISFRSIPFLGYPNQIFFSVILTLFSGLGYCFLRFIFWLWKKWQYLRRTRIQYNLTHAFVLIILAAIFLFLSINLTLSLFQYYPGSEPNLDASLIAQLFQDLLQTIFPVLLVYIFLASLTIIFAAPPLALISFLFTRKFTKRLIHLKETAAALKEGDLSARADIQGQDEIAQLQTTFNKMAENLEATTRALAAEHDKVAGLLNNQKEWTATISHELKTPVATLSAYLENNLNSEQDLPPQTRSDLEIMFHETQQLQNMINDLFTLTQSENQQLSLHLESINLNESLPAWVNPIKQLAWKNQRVEINTSIAADLPPIWADSVRVEQIILNLIHNALRHTAPGGIIQIQAEKQGIGARIHVYDTGEGIPKAELPYIWEKYYRGKQNQHRGSGLGLALVKELVTAMQGTVGVESKEDEGSHFWFDLPAPPAG